MTEFFYGHVPFATKRTNTNVSPWLTVELKNEIDYRDVLQRKFRKSKTTENYKKYKLQRNKVNNLIKRAKQNKNLLNENIKNATSFWRTLKNIFPTKPKSKLTCTTFKVNEEEISNKETITNGFGQFFSSIATTLLQILHPKKDFVWNKQKNVPIRSTPKFSFRSVTPSEICKCLRKLRRKKAHELPPNLFKDVANGTSKPLAFISNKSLTSGIVPDLWKYQKLHHFINRIQNETSGTTIQYLFYRVFLKY